MITKLVSAVLLGVEAETVCVEVDVSGQLPAFVIVGLPDASLKESRDRVKAAILNSQLPFPHTQKVTVNLAPADVRKEGAMYDLPIAVGILESSRQLPQGSVASYGFLGELSLDGHLRPVKGALFAVQGMVRAGVRHIVLPVENAPEASLIREARLYPASHLQEVVAHLRGEKEILPFRTPPLEQSFESPPTGVLLEQIVGQEGAKRALLLAAAGGHNLLLFGPPGSGKTMLAKSLASLLPPMEVEEIMEVTGLYSIAGQLDRKKGLVTERPVRSPHHTISDVGLIGGGAFPKPGEISLSHRGVLFLDELPEFSRKVLEVLRQPLEEGLIRIGRAQRSVIYPARFLFVGAMNPCPCGYYGQVNGRLCRCSSYAIQRYLKRLSGPLLDRIDLHLHIQKVPLERLLEGGARKGRTSEDVQAQVKELRKLQKERFQKEGIQLNGEMSSVQVERFCPLSKEAKRLLREGGRHLHLSARSCMKILKVARTIADADGQTTIGGEHIAEAIQYRQSEFLWG